MAIQPSFASENPILNDITVSVLAGSFTLVSRRNPCQLKSARAPPDTVFELDFTFGQINYSSLPFFNRGNNESLCSRRPPQKSLRSDDRDGIVCAHFGELDKNSNCR